MVKAFEVRIENGELRISVRNASSKLKAHSSQHKNTKH